jgi:hypothetical protein
MITIEAKRRGIEKNLQEMINRASSMAPFFNKNVYAQYQNVQRKRWMTENQSEAGTPAWPELNSTYKKWKVVKYASSPGRGTKMMIATDTLRKSVIGPGEGFRKIVTPRSLTIATTIQYAEHADKARTFSKYSPETMREFYAMIGDFIFKNKIKVFTNA